jgi:hypothetical protein
MHVLFRIISQLTPCRFPLDHKEGNQCTSNYQRYHNSRNSATSNFGASVTTVSATPSASATIIRVAST